MKVSLLTGGGDKPYALGLLDALISRGITVDFIGNDEMSNAEIVAQKNVIFLNLRGDQNPAASIIEKISRILIYYWRLLKYATTTDSTLFHILWLNKFLLFDRTLLNVYYKLLGKKLVFTAHNIDEKERDGGNHILNRLSLKILYTLMDHIFVHTTKMKSQLIQEFKIREDKVTVIPFGINNTIPTSNLTKAEARAELQLGDHEKVLLFFGNIAPYKGLEYVIDAIERLRNKDDTFRLIIAGRIKDCQPYWERLQRIVENHNLSNYIIRKIEYIPDEEVEVLFKSSDVLMLPYKFIYQSGVLFLSYSFGLPVIATDVGSLREEIVEGETGFICKPEDPQDLSEKIDLYFKSELFKNLEKNRKIIMEYANERYSWDKVGEITYGVYKAFL
ncbi:MAG: glycosyltransferase family 4 protein [Thermodesulfobacteriota bacterium]